VYLRIRMYFEKVSKNIIYLSFHPIYIGIWRLEQYLCPREMFQIV
jgi:hypothetical protein